LFDLAVNDLGINRLRLEIKSGVENIHDYWSDYQAGRIDYKMWRCLRYSTINDNDDPLDINWKGFHFAQLDYLVDNLVLPTKRKVEENREKLFINLLYVAFTDQIAPGLTYHHCDSPEEYAEFVLATYLHLNDKYGWVPNAWEVILEPDNTPCWRGKQIGEAIVASARRLEENGFAPRFIAPSTTDMANVVPYFDAMRRVPGVQRFVIEFSHHRYKNVSDLYLQEIGNRALEYGINTSMLEHIGSGHEDLHKDLKTGRASAWEQYALAYQRFSPPTEDDCGKYQPINDSNPEEPKIIIGT